MIYSETFPSGVGRFYLENSHRDQCDCLHTLVLLNETEPLLNPWDLIGSTWIQGNQKKKKSDFDIKHSELEKEISMQQVNRL